MLVHRDLDSLPVFKNAVVTIGTFDGVHLGHRKIITQLHDQALRCQGESVIITFEPHPRLVLNGNKPPVHLLTTLEEKIFLLEKEHVDHLVVVPFTKAFSQQSAEDYIVAFLVNKFCPHTIIIGYDHRFGHNREGGIGMLQDLAPRYGYQVLEIPAHVIHHITVSSTAIRKHLQQGDIGEANELLGYSYLVNGKVVTGDKRGRELGFPTANLSVSSPEKLIPGQGIYAARVDVPSPLSHPREQPETFMSAVNIGYQPTFDGKMLRVEAHMLDFNQDIYGRDMMISFYRYIRPDIKFSTPDELINRMKEDVEEVKVFFSGSSS